MSRPLSDDDLRALAALAEAATPGPWEHQPYRDEMVGDVAQSQPGGATIATIGDADWTYANGRFIAEASPDVVRELVARVLKAETLATLASDMATWISGCDSERHRPGCPKFDNDYASTCTCEADEGNIQRVRLLERYSRAVEAGR